MPSSREPAPARRPATEAEARALGSALRLRILRLCLHEPRTNKEIATWLDRDPASVLHHVRKLVQTGFLEPLPARRGRRGAREVPYQATGKSWTLDVRDTEDRRQRTAVMLEAFRAEIDADDTEAETARLGLKLNSRRRAELTERINALLEEYARAPADEDGEPWSLFIALHPQRQPQRRSRRSRG